MSLTPIFSHSKNDYVDHLKLSINWQTITETKFKQKHHNNKRLIIMVTSAFLNIHNSENVLFLVPR
jgi:hypothetical protein